MGKVGLYTKEQVIKAIDLARLQSSEPFLVKHREEEILNMLVSIELPSDEEINAKINSFPYTKHLDDGQYNEGIIEGFEMGVEWIEYYILTQAIHNENRRY